MNDTIPTVVQQRDVPEAIRALGALAEPDYVDLFSVTARRASDKSPEQWARTALEGASPVGRFVIWQVLCIWPPLSVGHRRAMPGLLRHAVRRIDRSRVPA